ncbi:hypothetical protein PSHT_08188, partial [Puccinia striiformis]
RIKKNYHTSQTRLRHFSTNKLILNQTPSIAQHLQLATNPTLQQHPALSKANSITEWNLVSGILPPLTAEDWETKFTKYRATPEFKLLNYAIGLEEFQKSFFWEWALSFLLPIPIFIRFGLIRTNKAGWSLAGIGALIGMNLTPEMVSLVYLSIAWPLISSWLSLFMPPVSDSQVGSGAIGNSLFIVVLSVITSIVFQSPPLSNLCICYWSRCRTSLQHVYIDGQSMDSGPRRAIPKSVFEPRQAAALNNRRDEPRVINLRPELLVDVQPV